MRAGNDSGWGDTGCPSGRLDDNRRNCQADLTIEDASDDDGQKKWEETYKDDKEVTD